MEMTTTPKVTYTALTLLAVYHSQFERSGGGEKSLSHGAGIICSYNDAIRGNVDIEARVGLSFRWIENGKQNYHFSCYHTGNTTVDTNGFIKKVSSIARLTNDPDMMTEDYLA